MLALSPAAVAQSTADVDADGWFRARSPHFSVYTNAGGDAAHEAALGLEALRGFLVDVAPEGRFDAEVPFHTYLFTDSDQLDSFQPGAVTGTAGILVPAEDGVYGATLWREGSDAAARFLIKQYIAWVLEENLPELPYWFRAGLIDYYSTFEVVEGEAHLGMPVGSHLRNLRPGLFARRQAEAVAKARGKAADGPAETGGGRRGSGATDPAAAETGPEAGEGEAEGERRGPVLRFSDDGEGWTAEEGQLRAVNPWDWALVHYLVLGNDETRPRVRPYLTALTAGRAPEEAFVEAFGKTRADFTRELEDYLLRDRHPFLRVPVVGTGVQDIRVEAMSPADVHARLGALRLQTVPAGDAGAQAAAADLAEDHFRKSLASEPEHPLARAGMAGLAARRGDLEAAAAGYRAAASGLPGNGLLQYHLGDTLLQSLGGRRPTSPQETERLGDALAALRRASELSPDFPAAWERLGYGLTLAPEPTAEAVSALERALELRPGRVDLVSNLLLARARVGDQAGVAAALERLRALGADAATLERGRDVELRLLVHQGQALVRAERLDDAVAAFAQVQAESSDPALVAAATEQLEFLGRVTQRNLYASLYQKAEAQIDAFHPEAATSVQELLTMARPGLQTEAARALAERLERSRR